MKKLSILIVILTISFYSNISGYTNITLNDSSGYSVADDLSISVNTEPECIPVISKYISENSAHPGITGLVKWKFYNNSNKSITITVSSEIQNWTPPIITQLNLGPNENKELEQTPFDIKILSNHTINPASILLQVKSNDQIIYEETRNVRIRAFDDIIWSLHSEYDMAALIAAWVTPHDSQVELILSRAKEKMYDRQLMGYYRKEGIKSEVKAIFNTVRNTKISFVDSRISFGKIGNSQRVRLPKVTIAEKSANCIDGTVLFASLFENLGLEPLIIIIPGHAFIGIRLAPNSNETLFIETTMVGRRVLESILTFKSTFAAAVKEGTFKYNNSMQNNPGSVHIIDIKKARGNGIYPLE